MLTHEKGLCSQLVQKTWIQDPSTPDKIHIGGILFKEKIPDSFMDTKTSITEENSLYPPFFGDPLKQKCFILKDVTSSDKSWGLMRAWDFQVLWPHEGLGPFLGCLNPTVEVTSALRLCLSLFYGLLAPAGNIPATSLQKLCFYCQQCSLTQFCY